MNRVFSQIILLSKKKKKVLVFKNLSLKYLSLLKCIWNAGFIYGFVRKKNNFIIYLKNVTNNILWRNIKLVGGRIFSYNQLKFLVNSELYSEFFVLTIKGFLVVRDCIKAGLGGQIFIKF